MSRLEYAALFGSVCCSSLWHVVGKMALENSHPNQIIFIFYRLSLASMVLLLVAGYSGGRKPETWKFLIPGAPLLLFLGCCKAVNALSFFRALSLSSPAVCALMQPTVPVFVLLIAWMRGEGGVIGGRRLAGVTLAVAGAVGGAWVGGRSSESASENSLLLALFFLILQASAIATLLTYQAKLLSAYPTAPALVVTGLIYACAGFVTFPLAVLQPWKDWGLGGNEGAWAALGYCVIFATAFSYGAITWATKRGVSPGTVSVFITLEPFITASLSQIFLGSGVGGGLFFVCGFLVAIGVALTLSDPDRKEENGFEMINKDVKGVKIGFRSQIQSENEEDTHYL